MNIPGHFTLEEVNHIKRTRIRKSKHGHWMTYHAIGYAVPHKTWDDAIRDAYAEFRRIEKLRIAEKPKRKSKPRKKKRTANSYNPTWNLAAKKRLLIRDGWGCHLCRKLNFPYLTVDHIVPRILKGPDNDLNVTLACADCNSKKSDQRSSCTCQLCIDAWDRFAP